MKAFWSVACPLFIQRFVTHWREIALVACAKVICVPRLLFFGKCNTIAEGHCCLYGCTQENTNAGTSLLPFIDFILPCTYLIGQL